MNHKQGSVDLNHAWLPANHDRHLSRSDGVWVNGGIKLREVLGLVHHINDNELMVQILLNQHDAHQLRKRGPVQKLVLLRLTYWPRSGCKHTPNGK